MVEKSEYLRTEIPCASCLQNLSGERTRDWLVCEHCGLSGAQKDMVTLTQMRATVVQMQGALVTRREQVMKVAGTIERSCGHARCWLFQSGLVLAPDNAPDLNCSCERTDLEQLIEAQAKAIQIFRGTA